MSVNNVCLVGRLGADPEMRRTRTGKSVCSLRLATERWTREGEPDDVEWHRVVVWEQTAERCGLYLKKGRLVAVEGRLSTRSWDDQDGRKRYLTEVVAARVSFLSGGGARDGAEEGSEEQSAAQPAGRPGPALDAEPLPF
ncbi:MAG: single-stranded DNA-binding protein [Myxococcota bacterium]